MPELAQGPWCSVDGDKWWVVTDRPDQALAEIARTDIDAFPIYFGWRATIERVCVRPVPEDRRDEEHEIEETRYSTDEGAVEAWRVTIEGR